MPVAASLSARLVAPDIRARVSEASHLAELCHVSGRLIRFMRTRYPVEIVRSNNAVGHNRKPSATHQHPRCRFGGGCRKPPKAAAHPTIASLSQRAVAVA